MNFEKIELAHGAGGLKMDQLIKFISDNLTLSKVEKGFDNTGLESLDDGAVISKENFDSGPIVVSADGHTVDPLFFPGGDIGKLAVCGTLNDVVMMGAKPIAMTSSLIIEEGFSTKDLRKILLSMDEECVKNNVPIITGDTKVVPKGTLDKLIIATTGIGVRISNYPILDSNTKVDDKIIITGPIGSHGISLLSFRKGIEFSTNLTSDVNSLASLILPMISKYQIHTMKDPTRGGLSSALNEVASKSKVDIMIYQDNVPIEEAVKSAAELLGLDPFEITCEGQAIISIPADQAENILEDLKKHEFGKQSAIIGDVKQGEGKVYIETSAGGLRRLQKPVGELIPRVC